MTKGDKVVSMKQNSRISYQNGNQIYLEIFEKGAKDKCLCYGKGPLELKGFCHSEMAGDAETQVHKWLCYILAGGAISWWSRLQRIVAPSTTDVEYISATEASKKAI